MIESLATLSPILAYFSVLALMVCNGITNLPSSQLLYIFTGYISTVSEFSPLWFIVAGAIGNTIGNIALYELVLRNKTHLLSLGISVSDESLKRFDDVIKKHGILYVFVGKLIPGVKVFVPVVAGFFKLQRFSVYLALFVSSLIWAGLLVSVGIVFGRNADITLWYMALVLIIISFVYMYTYRHYPELFKRM